ncbi:MAG: peptidase M22 [Eubacterium sp.]|nr:peptidase M22 [Eubacterium sp.]
MYLGIDTSNYTTSCALFDGETVIQKKRMLTVREGERGLRQSEALFQHTVNMPALLSELPEAEITAVGVSTRPRSVEGSYMPCFLAGKNSAVAAAYSAGAALYETSHQTGHIIAALWSAKRLDLIHEKHIAFHLSGGTTEALLVTPDKENVIDAEIVSSSLDLKAGQAIDRTGVMLGLRFPCGKELDSLSLNSEAEYKYKPSMKESDCSLSGVENKARKMLENNESAGDIAKFVLTCVAETVCAMLEGIIKEYGSLPVIFSGGVSSNTLLRNKVKSKFNAYFAEPDFSLDNAAGCAIYAYLKENEV